jgi:hypothetical protein
MENLRIMTTQKAKCHCDSTRYQLMGEPSTCYTCHCTDCQSESGSAFTLSMLVKRDQVTVLAGEVSVNQYQHNGALLNRHGCKHCGSALWYSADAHTEYCALKPGAFEDKTWFKPIAHLWVSSAPAWVVFDEQTPRYQTQPRLCDLFELWREKTP